MKRISRFSLTQNWQLLLNDIDIDFSQALGLVGLPENALNRSDSSLSVREYFQMWRVLEQLSGERELPVLLAQKMSLDIFDPALFTCVCSKNMQSAMQRLSEFKPLVSPMRMNVSTADRQLQVDLTLPLEALRQAPQAFALTELAFITQIARLTTRSHVVPSYLSVPFVVKNSRVYTDYFGNELTQSDCIRIRFTEEDAHLPFLTANAKIWSFFDGRLRSQLRDLPVDATIAEQVQAVLNESLPTGNATVDAVANILAMSKRSLQRKLAAENFSFQTLLQQVRAELADHYLEKSTLSLSEISFMLGFHEPNSFIRAYTSWKGQSPGQHRQQYHIKQATLEHQKSVDLPG